MDLGLHLSAHLSVLCKIEDGHIQRIDSAQAPTHILVVGFVDLVVHLPGMLLSPKREILHEVSSVVSSLVNTPAGLLNAFGGVSGMRDRTPVAPVGAARLGVLGMLVIIGTCIILGGLDGWAVFACSVI